MHELLFCDAVRPARVSILKLPMRAYSLGHEVILHSRRNALVTLGEKEFAKLAGEEQRTAIILAADVCCQSWEEYHTDYSAEDKAALDAKWETWKKAIANADYPLAIAEFRIYRLDGAQTFPTEEMPSTDGEFRYFGQPELASLFNFLTITCGLPETAAWDYPLGLARMRRLAWLESEGNARITNAVEAEIARRRDEYLKAHPEPEFEILPADK
jgi:hypothetical protein